MPCPPHCMHAPTHTPGSYPWYPFPTYATDTSIHSTWSRYLACILCLAAHILQGFWPFFIMSSCYNLYTWNLLLSPSPFPTPSTQLPHIITWSRYLACILCLAAHILQGFWPFFIISNWFTMMLCVSIPHLVSSCTSRSVSYSDRNSAMQTHTKVVWSWKRKGQILASFYIFYIPPYCSFHIYSAPERVSLFHKATEKGNI